MPILDYFPEFIEIFNRVTVSLACQVSQLHVHLHADACIRQCVLNTFFHNGGINT